MKVTFSGPVEKTRHPASALPFLTLHCRLCLVDSIGGLLQVAFKTGSQPEQPCHPPIRLFVTVSSCVSLSFGLVQASSSKKGSKSSPPRGKKSSKPSKSKKEPKKPSFFATIRAFFKSLIDPQ